MSEVTGSSSRSSDPDWSQVGEIVRTLDLAIAQIGMAMLDGEDSVGSLTESFSDMADKVSVMAATLGDAGQEGNNGPGADLGRHCAQLQAGIQQTVVAFQFYDRLSQRLDHVRGTLAQLAELVAEPTRLHSPQEWHALQQQVRASSPMEQEQRLFDALLAGAGVDEVLDAFRRDREPARTGPVELF